MDLIPVRTVHLSSALPPRALAERLSAVIGRDRGAIFTGAVAADRFVITHMNEYRSTSMPRLGATLTAGPGGGSLVLVRLRPPGTVFVFMGIWLAFLAGCAAVIVAAHVQDANRSLLLLLAPGVLAALSWLLMASVFAADSRWAVAHLVDVVPALHPGGIP